MKKLEIVKHHNRLTEPIVDYDPIELNVFIGIIHKMHKKNDTVVFDMKDIKQYTNSKNRGYKQFSEVIKKLQEKRIELKMIDGYKSISPFPTLEFNLAEKTIKVKFHDEIIPMLRDLKKHFTLYSIDEFINLENKHAKRLFQLLKQYQKAGKRNCTVDYLRAVLNVEYERFYDLEKHVLIKAKDEINKYTTLEIAYKKNKQGKTVTSLEFSIRVKKDKMTKKTVKIETRKEVIERALETFEVKLIRDLTEMQKNILNNTLKSKNFNSVR